jgi:hypothetical protein
MRVTRRTVKTFELELTMRDVLGNLEELTLQEGYHFSPDCFQLLSVEAESTDQSDTSKPTSASILPFTRSA